ncbi:hypothetical protein [Streptomyces coerulescens]|uniref:MmyB-like transcription regulator ligand binding domain-containing protein n=1 Tax=Streptomyces coerulescens TaxID=29304 RepID=A0ABW0CWC3_STRCD
MLPGRRGDEFGEPGEDGSCEQEQDSGAQRRSSAQHQLPGCGGHFRAPFFRAGACDEDLSSARAEQGTAGVVAQLRAAVGSDADDPRLAQLIGELSLKSERFRQLWARRDVRRGGGAITRLMHPQVGELHLRREKLAVAGDEGSCSSSTTPTPTLPRPRHTHCSALCPLPIREPPCRPRPIDPAHHLRKETGQPRSP